MPSDELQLSTGGSGGTVQKIVAGPGVTVDPPSGRGVVTLASAGDVGRLTWVATKNAPYVAHRNEGVPVDTSGGPVAITTPVGPLDGDLFTVKLVTAGNPVTVVGPIDGGVNKSFTLVKQSLTFSYDALAGTWQII